MELEAQHPIGAMQHRHRHLLVMGDHFQLVRHIGGDQRVVAGHRQRVGKAAEHILAAVVDERALAVDDLPGRADGAAIVFTDGLVPQADAENGHLAAAQADELKHAAGFVRRTGTGGEHQHRVIGAGGDLGIDLRGRQAVAIDAHIAT